MTKLLDKYHMNVPNSITTMKLTHFSTILHDLTTGNDINLNTGQRHSVRARN